MTQAVQVDILDLRHFSASSLKPLLDVENQAWSERLRWNYRTSIDLILQYLDSRVLPGFVAVEGTRVIGYVFCVYEDAKAVIGDVFSTGSSDGRLAAQEIERQLLEQLIQMLQHSPGTERIESQLLLHASGRLAQVFRAHDFQVYQRDFMQMRLTPETAPGGASVPTGLRMRSWAEEDFTPAAHLISEAYAGHLDSRINDQYQTIPGSLRFLHNIVRFPGCGLFDAAASRVLVSESTGEMAGVLLCSRVQEKIGHVTQICMAPRWRRRGLGAAMLQDCAAYLCKRGFESLTLTVTQANYDAVRLYERLGFVRIHSFDAVLWVRGLSAHGGSVPGIGF
uniref:GNAT family N-acetyltransferase n=1 Tax=Acidobacterium capsulatum TaxID=33075 RepID=A0A7V5CS82_9BACT